MELDAHTRVVVLTGYGSIATAVEAVKTRGALLLTKPLTPTMWLPRYTTNRGHRLPDFERTALREQAAVGAHQPGTGRENGKYSATRACSECIAGRCSGN